MAERKRGRFETVRRGYDVDEVDEHLDAVERQHQHELAALQNDLAERDRQIAELQLLTAEVEEAKKQRASISAMLQDAGRRRQEMLDGASEDARNRLDEAESTARELRRETEREIAELRHKTEEAMQTARSGVDAKVDRKIQAARDEARLIVANAEAAVDLLKRQTDDRLHQRQRSQARELEQRQLEADREHMSTIRSYRTAEKELAARVEHLQGVRDSLVASLTAIAEGGLRAGGRLNLPTTVDTTTVGDSAEAIGAQPTDSRSDNGATEPADVESVATAQAADDESNGSTSDPAGESMAET